MTKIEKLKRFLQKNYPNIQAFNSRNVMGDDMKNVYDEDGIKVDYCYSYEYIEIFGLTNEEFKDLLDPELFFVNRLKTFEFDEVI